MRPEAQLSDPMKWDTSVYNKIIWEDINFGMHVLLSPEPFYIGREALPSSKRKRSPRNWISSTSSSLDFASFNLRPTMFVCVITKNGGEIKLDSLDGVSTSCLDTGLPISHDDRGKLPLCVPGK